ncbi:SAM-dependent methyltransferase [Aurantibacillus circumpalustris]|uniref:SAM-dependent methyltransferase n=1 Tax=Aurantibacillus circumpalustris TaxID=3036359 RepID=UPI00295AF55C|nr:SAM-dependent methyltransferase [Aurantibacillus circumpalustris]
MKSFGKLYLLPVPIVEENGHRFIPDYNSGIINTLTKFICEDAKTARRFLKGFGYTTIQNAEIFLLNEHTKTGELSSLLNPLLNGENIGLMSDAGCPGIADPGAEVVKLAHQKNIEVVPLVGPSSIVLSIMAAGFNGQNFAFVGYLPIDKTQKIKRLKELEQLVFKQKQAQFFIETPYRNEQMFDTLLECLSPQTLVFIGRDITSAKQYLVAKTVVEWKKAQKPAMHKVPVVYGIYC